MTVQRYPAAYGASLRQAGGERRLGTIPVGDLLCGWGSTVAVSDGTVATITPLIRCLSHRIPDNMQAGDVTSIPPFIATASFDIDTDSPNSTVGCIAVLMEGG